MTTSPVQELPIERQPEPGRLEPTINQTEILPDISDLKKDEVAFEKATALNTKEHKGEGVLTEEPLEKTPMPTADAYEKYRQHPVYLETEKILQQGLIDYHKDKPPTGIFPELPAGVQPMIKEKGEETARLIAESIKKNKGKLDYAEVYSLIFDWLSLIPNANLIFLTQAAKNKTDILINYKSALEIDPNSLN